MTRTTSPRGRRRRGRAPSAPARGRGRPRPAPRGPGARRCRWPACSSSKTVGSVRTGMPRSRAARTTRARSVPGADGIAIIISSGSASSRMRGSCVGRAEHLDAVDAQRALERVVVDEADGREAELRVAQDLAQDSRPPSPAPTMSTRRASRARAEAARAGARRRRRADEARAADEQPAMSRKNSARTPVGADTVTSPLVRDGTVTGWVSADERDERERRDDDRLQDRDVVARAACSATASARAGRA